MQLYTNRYSKFFKIIIFKDKGFHVLFHFIFTIISTNSFEKKTISFPLHLEVIIVLIDR